MTDSGSTRALALGALLLGAAVVAVPGAARAQTSAPFRIGVVEDLSGMYAGNGGPDMVLATTMAVEDFGGKVLGRPVEVLAVDHENKPDIGAGPAHAGELLLGPRRRLARLDAALPSSDHPLDWPFDLAEIAAVTALDYLVLRFPDVDWRGHAPRLAAFRDAQADRPSVREAAPRA